MGTLSFLSPAQHELLCSAGVAVLLPRHARADQLRGGVQTTVRAGRKLPVAFSVFVASDEAEPAFRLEVQTILRDSRTASIPSVERSDAHDRAFMAEYLEREARSTIAMRSLELAEGAAYTLATPLDQLILARHAELPQTQPAEVHVDHGPVQAASVSFGAHTATWADLPAERIAFVVHARGHAGTHDLVACSP